MDCEANVWGTYHYSGLETKKEAEFAEQTIKYAANHDEDIYQLLDSLVITDREVRSPEIPNSTLSSKKIFDTSGGPSLDVLHMDVRYAGFAGAKTRPTLSSWAPLSREQLHPTCPPTNGDILLVIHFVLSGSLRRVSGG